MQPGRDCQTLFSAQAARTPQCYDGGPLQPAARMSWLITNTVAAFLLPPLALLCLFGLGLLLLRRRRKLASALLVASFALLWLSSTPYVAEGALHLLESQTQPVDLQRQPADAIIILGGGSYANAPEYGGQDTVSYQTLERLRYAARLQRQTGLPLLVSGGKPEGNTLSEAEQMKRALEQDFQAPVRWVEAGSDNTAENARHSFELLQANGIRKIYLVTHAWHMPRAAAVFRRTGFEVVDAPTAFTTRYRIDVLAFLPRAESLRDSKIFVHEVIGLLWYRLKSAS